MVFSVFSVRVAIQHKDPDTGEREVLARMRIQLRVDYAAPDGFCDNEDAVRHFLGTVGWMNVWPYVRAEVQTLSAKLGFPQLTLPLLLSGQTRDIPVVRMPEEDQDLEEDDDE